MQVRKADVTFLAAAGAPPLVQTLLQSSGKPQGGLLLIGPEGGMCEFSPLNLFSRSVIEKSLEGGTVRVPTSYNYVSLWKCVPNV
jgi:16S rRNA U1498 N3-methylase RsmE